MDNILSKFTIVTITCNDLDGLKDTINSIRDLLDVGARNIIINGGKKIGASFQKEWLSKSLLFEQKDEGIYDALNIGISNVETDYFMLLHAGDRYIATAEVMNEIIKGLEKHGSDLSLNDQLIPSVSNIMRIHSVRLWRPWFLKFGAQPGHLPTIYRTSFASQFKYSVNKGFVADYYYFVTLFEKNVNFRKDCKLLVRMAPGGHTSSGLKSLFRVSKELGNGKSSVLAFRYILRIPLKLLQMIRC